MCLNDTNYQNANWISIQSGQTQNGTCIDNYYGSPTRQCFQSGSNNPIGVWNSNVNNPCIRSLYYFILFICVFSILSNSNNMSE